MKMKYGIVQIVLTFIWYTICNSKNTPTIDEVLALIYSNVDSNLSLIFQFDFDKYIYYIYKY